MEKKHGQKKVNTKLVISELHRAFKLFNEQLFNGNLPEPVILVASRGNKKLTLGWCTVEKVWKNEITHEERYEINLVAESLNRGIYPVMATLLHEMIHLHNLVYEIKDVSRGGTYHNMKFKKVAEEHGLIIEHNEKIGWSLTKIQGTTMDIIDKAGFDEAVFSLGRREMASEGDKKRKKKKSSVRKYVCPNCGCIIRASKLVNVICGDCYEKDEILIKFIEEVQVEDDSEDLEPTYEGTDIPDYEVPEEPEFENPVEYVCQECGCLSTDEKNNTSMYVCSECGSSCITILNGLDAEDEEGEENEPTVEPMLIEEPTQLDDGAGNMVDVVQGKFEVSEMGRNEKRLAEVLAEAGYVIGCYDKRLEDLKYMALKKVWDNALMLEHTDVHIKINGVEHIVEIATIDNEKDFNVMTVEEYRNQYGDNE